MDAKARLVGQVVAAVHAREEVPRLVVAPVQVLEDVADPRRRDLERRLAAVERGAGDRVVPDRVADALGDQLQAGRVDGYLRGAFCPAS